jgi:hypothetical protein
MVDDLTNLKSCILEEEQELTNSFHPPANVLIYLDIFQRLRRVSLLPKLQTC